MHWELHHYLSYSVSTCSKRSGKRRAHVVRTAITLSKMGGSTRKRKRERRSRIAEGTGGRRDRVLTLGNSVRLANRRTLRRLEHESTLNEAISYLARISL